MSRPKAAELPDVRLKLLRSWQPGGIHYKAVMQAGGQQLARIWSRDPVFECKLAEDTCLGELYYVTEDMVALLERAAPSMPEQPLMTSDLPRGTWVSGKDRGSWPPGIERGMLHHGIVFFERPMFGTDSGGNKDPLQVDAVSWVVWGSAEAKGPMDLYLGISSYQYIAEGKFAFAASSCPYAFLGRSDWKLGMAPSEFEPDHQINTEQQRASIIEDRKVMAALFTILRNPPKVTELAEERIPRWFARRSQRAGVPSKVVLVRLRKRDEDKEPVPAGSSGRHYSHRILVGEYWRNTWYPSLGIHRAQLVAESVRGPKDKPLIIKDHVRVL
jgi:hypothetical protein